MISQFVHLPPSTSHYRTLDMKISVAFLWQSINYITELLKKLETKDNFIEIKHGKCDRH